MSHDHSHVDMLQGLHDMLMPVFEHSAQAMYIYLDDESKVCNEQFATLLGYDSADEWAHMQGSFPALFVADESQEALVEAYQNAMEKMVASTNSITWKKKTGETVQTTVILVPIDFEGHLFALHFIQ
jgi:hypothetical protein